MDNGHCIGYDEFFMDHRNVYILKLIALESLSKRMALFYKDVSMNALKPEYLYYK